MPADNPEFSSGREAVHARPRQVRKGKVAALYECLAVRRRTVGCPAAAEAVGVTDVSAVALDLPLKQFSKSRGGYWLAGAMEYGLCNLRRGHISA